MSRYDLTDEQREAKRADMRAQLAAIRARRHPLRRWYDRWIKPVLVRTQVPLRRLFSRFWSRACFSIRHVLFYSDVF